MEAAAHVAYKGYAGFQMAAMVSSLQPFHIPYSTTVFVSIGRRWGTKSLFFLPLLLYIIRMSASSARISRTANVYWVVIRSRCMTYPPL